MTNDNNEAPKTEAVAMENDAAMMGHEAADIIRLVRDLLYARANSPMRDCTDHWEALEKKLGAFNADAFRQFAENMHALMHGFHSAQITAISTGYNKASKQPIVVVQVQIGPMLLAMKKPLEPQQAEDLASSIHMALDMANPKRLVDAHGQTLNGKLVV